MPAVERTRVRDHGQIPRPPNSWILYRSDMVSLLPPPPPGTTRSQAEVSRMISQMWKNEAPEVKAEYERRAEVKKLEHAALYPHYRYMPKSKELKEELKKNKDLAKKNKRKQKEDGHQAPEASRPLGSGPPTQEFAPFTSFPFPFLSDPANYSPAGPSPPMSAADSPSPEPFPQPQPVDATNERVDTRATSSQNVNSYYRQHTALPQTQPPCPIPKQPDYQPATTSHYRTITGESQADEDQNAQQQYQSPQDTHMNQVGLVQDQQYAFMHNASQQGDASSSQDYLAFDLQQFAGQNLAAWALQNSEFQPALDQFLNNTSGDCYQMQINPVDQLNLADAPVGPLEVELGQVGFDLSQLLWESTSAPKMGTHQSFFENATIQNGGFDSMAGPSSQASSEGSALPSADADQGFRFDQFINFDPTFDYIPPTPVTVPEETPSPDTVQRTPYAPPAGAIHSSKRRVAASWNPSFAITDPIDV
ncbi:putative high mobility group [Lyophyllum shimeji]|uniref:High mobility group n=1 Tax=Lyophyllum shimeji TaxID=47721 RepID=A0A9P3PKZ2_LYOSH|nr:putative high mobility group [Lyophyllum shimeji]